MKKLNFMMIIFGILLSLHPFAQENRCDYKVEILVDSDQYKKEEFKWRMRATKIEGESTNITGTAEIKDSVGKKIKSYKPWSSDSISRQKTSSEYSPNLKQGEYEIRAEIEVKCEDINKDNNIDVKSIRIIDEKSEEPKSKNKKVETDEPKIEISKLKKKENKEALNKNDKDKSENKIMQETKPKKPKTYNVTENVIQPKKSLPKNPESQLTSKVVQAPQIIYESSNEKAKGLIMIFLLTLSILLNIILIWRR